MKKNYLVSQHLERLRSALLNLSALTVADWIPKNTFLQGKPFSFMDHEYQRIIAEDQIRIKYVMKCSQCGITELSIRELLAFLQIYSGTNAIYVLPTATFSQTVAATRLNPIIDASPALRAALHPATDSALVKRFVNDSFVFMKGASKGSQAISIPCDYLVIDEEDFAQSPEILTAFTSRLTHSLYKIERHFSTPTFPNRGIHAGFADSIQHVQLNRCTHCNHEFIPDYYKDVVLPSGTSATATAPSEVDLSKINFFTKALLAKHDLSKAYIRCPNPTCHRPLYQEHTTPTASRRFVQVNPSANFEAHGYHITPFCAPKRLHPGEIIRLSTRYRSKRDFLNNTLGIPHADASSGFTDHDIDRLFTTFPNANIYPTHPEQSPYAIMGTDMGGTCAHFTAYPAPDGHLRITHAELIPLHTFTTRYPELATSHNSVSSIVDAFPYTSTIASLQSNDPRLWAATFSSRVSVNPLASTQQAKQQLQQPGLREAAAFRQPFRIKDVEQDITRATYAMQLIEIDRDVVLEMILDAVRAPTPRISIALNESTAPLREVIAEHFQDMKRVEGDESSSASLPRWLKSSQGQDHFLMALVYLFTAELLKSYQASYNLTSHALSSLPVVSKVSLHKFHSSHR